MGARLDTERGVWRVAALALAVLLSGCSTWVCDPTTCDDGCCQADGTCAVANTQDRCGLHGAACQSCTSAQTCEKGVCELKCTPSKCPTGCCDASSNCITANNQSAKACGTYGRACVSCQSNESCGTMGCGPKCTPNNCGLGCCTFEGQCIPFGSESPYQCGTAGQACTQCYAPTTSCIQGTCCRPANASCTVSPDTCCAPNECIPSYTGAATGYCQ